MTYVPQRDRAWLKQASTDEINAAKERGELNELLGAPVPRDYSGAEQLTRADLAGMTSEQVADAMDAGLCENLKGGK